MISNSDKDIIRGLARSQMEHAMSDRNQMLIKEWKKHKSFCGQRPMICLEMWGFQDEMILPRLQCEGKEAREIEYRLYNNFLNAELFDDDTPVPGYFPVRWHISFLPFGFKRVTEHAKNTEGNSLGYMFIHLIEDLEKDYHKLSESEYSVDRVSSLEEEELLNELFGDILPVRRIMDCLVSVPTQDIVSMMSMENMLLFMYDYPNLFHDMMKRLSDDYISYFKWMEKESLLSRPVDCEQLYQGSFSFANELPSSLPGTRPVRTNEVWGYMDSQESAGISPKMFGDFIFPYYKRIAECFGPLSYACCEPVHAIWDDYLSKLNNIRKLSISPWCDEEFMGDRLRGRRIVYHRKPNSNYLGFGDNLDEEALKEHIKTTLKFAKGCTLEITQRDVYTINNDIPKARRFIEVIRECVDTYWQG